MSSFDREESEEVRREPLAFAADALSLSVEEFALDDDEEFFDVESRDPISLVEWEDEWNELTLRGELEVQRDLSSELFPESERDEPPGEFVIAAECDSTHLRRGYNTEVNDFSEATHTVEVTVSRSDYQGKFTIRPILVRTDPGGDSGEYRTVPGVALADGEETTVVIDEIEEGEDVILPSSFKSFGDSDSETYPDDALYVTQRAEPSRPKLFVNSDHDEIYNTLTSGPRGHVGRAMKVYRDAILLPSYVDLILWTAENTDEEGQVQYDWQEAVLETFVTEMYDTEDRAEAAERLHEHFHGDGSVNELMDEASVTLQRYFEVDESMTKLTEMIQR